MSSMIRRTALVALVGLLAAAPAVAAQTAPRPVPAPPAPAPIRNAPVLPRPLECAPPSTAAPAPAPPSQALLGALGILRRAAEAKDALPADVLRLLRARRLAPVDPASARLLRATPDGGRAWIVPVPDVGAAGFELCAARRDPAEGVVVVAKGGAPAGGGAALADLVRGRGAVSVDVCAGPNRDMLGVSGVVPDGVSAAYLTAPDGTAVRADVVDNGYAFVVPNPRRPEQRYVVWIGADGTPHVQPVPPTMRMRRSACDRLPAGLIRVTPEPEICRLAPVLAPPPALPGRRLRRVPHLSLQPCLAAPVPAIRVPRLPRP
jgi:hypothetical protein